MAIAAWHREPNAAAQWFFETANSPCPRSGDEPPQGGYTMTILEVRGRRPSRSQCARLPLARPSAARAKPPQTCILGPEDLGPVGELRLASCARISLQSAGTHPGRSLPGLRSIRRTPPTRPHSRLTLLNCSFYTLGCSDSGGRGVRTHSPRLGWLWLWRRAHRHVPPHPCWLRERRGAGTAP